MKKKTYITSLIVACVIIVLESLPYGAVLNFGQPASDGSIEFLRKTYSYFDLTAFGYANFGPFLTAILSCVLLSLIAISIFIHKRVLFEKSYIISSAALLTSLMPLQFGIKSYSTCGLAISILLAAEIIINWIGKRKTYNPRDLHNG